MLLEYFLSALLLGFIVAIPPGSVTIAACQRALQYGFKNSLIFSCGSCLSDIFYLSLVFLGVAVFMAENPLFKVILWVISGVILILLGTVSLLSLRRHKRTGSESQELSPRPWAAFFSGILITLTNPLTIAGWLAVAGNFYLIWSERLPGMRKYTIITIIVIMCGVLAWFIPLILVVSRLKRIIPPRLKNGLIVAANLCLLAFGVVALYYAGRAMVADSVAGA